MSSGHGVTLFYLKTGFVQNFNLRDIFDKFYIFMHCSTRHTLHGDIFEPLPSHHDLEVHLQDLLRFGTKKRKTDKHHHWWEVTNSWFE
jgi:hypothetical protein